MTPLKPSESISRDSLYKLTIRERKALVKQRDSEALLEQRKQEAANALRKSHA
jgi:hypothetical protein